MVFHCGARSPDSVALGSTPLEMRHHCSGLFPGSRWVYRELNRRLESTVFRDRVWGAESGG